MRCGRCVNALQTLMQCQPLQLRVLLLRLLATTLNAVLVCCNGIYNGTLPLYLLMQRFYSGRGRVGSCVTKVGVTRGGN